jgi:uracil-DNA glycosylase
LDKATGLAELVKKRRSEMGTEYHHLHTFDMGHWDCEYLVPWTKSACNLDAQLMIIGQDWASERFLMDAKYNTPKRILDREEVGQDEYLPTNRRLKLLLRKHFRLEFSETYATDVSIFIKPGTMTGNVAMKDLKYCAEMYTLPQIKIVNPIMALCLGAKTFSSLRRALDMTDMKLQDAYVQSPHTTCGTTEIYGVPHTGGLGHANAGGMDKVDEIWAGLAARFEELLF